jgi:hypothetical protein
MGWRLYRRIPLAPGLRLNVSPRRLSLSVGHKGFWLTSGPAGRRASVSIPETGLRYTTALGSRPPLKPVPSAARAVVWITVTGFVVWIIVTSR